MASARERFVSEIKWRARYPHGHCQRLNARFATSLMLISEAAEGKELA
jgi:hypothetical protein